MATRLEFSHEGEDEGRKEYFNAVTAMYNLPVYIAVTGSNRSFLVDIISESPSTATNSLKKSALQQQQKSRSSCYI